MNYYMTNGLTTLEPENPSYTVTIPAHMTTLMFSDKRHDELLRCKDCNIKFDTHLLIRVGIGKFLCKFCLNKTA